MLDNTKGKRQQQQQQVLPHHSFVTKLSCNEEENKDEMKKINSNPIGSHTIHTTNSQNQMNTSGSGGGGIYLNNSHNHQSTIQMQKQQSRNQKNNQVNVQQQNTQQHLHQQQQNSQQQQFQQQQQIQQQKPHQAQQQQGYMAIQLSPLYLNQKGASMSTKSTSNTPQTNASPTFLRTNSTNSSQNTIQGISQNASGQPTSILKNVNQNSSLFQQNSLINHGNNVPVTIGGSANLLNKEKIQQKISDLNNDYVSQKKFKRSQSRQKEGLQESQVISSQGRNDYEVNNDNYQGISYKQPIQTSNVHVNFSPNFSQIENKIMQQQIQQNLKKNNFQNNLQHSQQVFGPSNQEIFEIEYAKKNKQKKNLCKFPDEKIQDDQRTVESKQSYILNQDNQETAAQFMPSLIGKKTPFSQKIGTTLPQQRPQFSQQQHQSRIVLNQTPQIKSIQQQHFGLNQQINNSDQNITQQSLQQQQNLQQSNQISYQSIIPNYFESQQQLKEVNLLTSSLSSNSSNQLVSQNPIQSSKSNLRSNSSFMFNTNSMNKQIISSSQSQKNSKQSKKKKYNQSNPSNQQIFYQNAIQQSSNYQNRHSKSQDSYQYFLDKQNNKQEVKEEDEEDEEEEEEDDEEEDEEEEVTDQKNNFNEKQIEQWNSNNQKRSDNIRSNTQLNNGQLIQNFQSVQEQNASDEYNSDEEFEDEIVNGNRYNDVGQYDGFFKDQNQQMEEQEYDEDDNDNSYEEEDFNDEEIRDIHMTGDIEKGGRNNLNNINQYMNKINKSSKHNTSSDKIHSISQVNTSSYDQMKTLVSPVNINRKIVQQYQQNLKKNIGSKRQLRSNTSLGDDENGNFGEYDENYDNQGEESHLTSFTYRQTSKSNAINYHPNSNQQNSKINSPIKVKKKSNTMTTKQNYNIYDKQHMFVQKNQDLDISAQNMKVQQSNLIQQQQLTQQNEGFNKLVMKNVSNLSQSSLQNGINSNTQNGGNINNKQKKKSNKYLPRNVDQVLYQNYQQSNSDLNNDSFYQSNQVGSIMFSNQQQKMHINNCNQYKFNIQNVNIQHAPQSGYIQSNLSGNQQGIEQIDHSHELSMLLFKKNNNLSETQIGAFVSAINQSDIPLQHHIKGLDQIGDFRDTNNSIVEKQAPEPPPPAQYSKYELSQGNNYLNKNQFSQNNANQNQLNNNPNNTNNINNNNNGKNGSFFVQNGGQIQQLDQKQKVKLIHFSSIEATPQSSQFCNTPQRGVMNPNAFNNFNISPRLYGNDKISNANITQSILFAPSQHTQQQQWQNLNQLKRDQLFFEDQQENLKSYIISKQREKQQLKKKYSDDTTSINNHLTQNSPNNQNSQVKSKKKSKDDTQKVQPLKMCMSTVLLDQTDDGNQFSKSVKQRVYSQQPYLEDPQIKKQWVLSRVKKMQIDLKLANILIENINLYCHTKEVILEKLIQSIFSYQTLNLKLRKKSDNELSVVQAAKNRTTQIIRSVSQLFTSSSNSYPSQQDTQQKMMQRIANNMAIIASNPTSLANNRANINDNQIVFDQEELTQYERDYIHENSSSDEEYDNNIDEKIQEQGDRKYKSNNKDMIVSAADNYRHISQQHHPLFFDHAHLSNSVNNSSFIHKKSNHFKQNNIIDKVQTKNSKVNALRQLQNHQQQSMSNSTHDKNGGQHPRPHSFNVYNDNSVSFKNIAESINGNSNNKNMVQLPQSTAIFQTSAKEKQIRVKHQEQSLYDLDQQKGINGAVNNGNMIVLQQVGNENPQSLRKKENSKFRRGNSRMDFSSISISNDQMSQIKQSKVQGNLKSVITHHSKERQGTFDYKNFPLTQSNNMSPTLPQASQINQREQSFSFNKNENVCPICNHENDQLYELSKRCGHKFCLYCIRQYIENKIYSNDILKIRCPNPSHVKACKYKIRSENFKPFISPELFAKYKNFKKLLLKRQNPNIRYCTKEGCDGCMLGSEEHPKLTCPKCQQEICYHCCNNWHQGMRCDQAFEEDVEYEQKDTGKYSCPFCQSKINVFKQLDGGISYSNKNVCSTCNKAFCNLCRRSCGQFHFAPWNICYGCPGQKYSLEEPQFCEKFCIFLWGVMKLMLYAFLSLIALAIYPFIVAIVSLFMPLIIYAYFKGQRLQYSGFKKYLLLFCLFLLGIILYPIWLIIAFVPGTCLFFKDMYFDKKLYADEIDQSQVNQ